MPREQTGGVTLTLSLAYLGVLAHQRNRERQAAVLRQQTLALTAALHDPLPPKLPPITRAERAAEERRGLVEAAKTRWNAEVEAAVRWAQKEDWDAARARLESAVGSAWARAFGDAIDDAASAEQEIGRRAAQARDAAGDLGSSAAAKAEAAAADAGSGIFGAIGKAFSSLGGSSRSEDKAAAEKQQGDAASSPQEKILQQRYQQSRPDDRTPEEILAERYAGGDKKNDTRLKTI